MKTQERSFDDDERAMADLAEVADWRRLWGPPATGTDAIRALVDRVTAATGWRPWAPGNIDPDRFTWGLVTQRETVMLVLPDAVLPESPRSGWAAYEIAPSELAQAEEGLDTYWPEQLQRARRFWGPPVYVGPGYDPRIPPEWRGRRRHLAVWLRPGAEFHLYASQPGPDDDAAGFGYSVYASEVA
ncbi:hypothetical protein GCM10009630_47570 [Kribbella jejuensis]|uniref:Uncharacterized protein n=1 Tax=Kribbella jejuensis TaxID=236068 RepID=A0A542E739_9ACTN|nr:hypothetical protein [Kribbella jejuensis]TQJ11145.1 hypothetical protein FB475_4053 [Kribbella jejuensis]